MMAHSPFPAPAGTAAASGPGASAAMVLQRLILPGPDSAADLAVRGGQIRDGALCLSPGEAADFGTWLNFFDATAWERSFAHAPRWRLAGQGRVMAELYRWTAATGPGLICETVATLDRGTVIPIPPGPGLVGLRLRALGEVRIRGGAIHASDARGQTGGAAPVRLAIVMTTYRRERAASTAAARLRGLLATGALGPQARLFVIDNGNSLHLPAHPRQTVLGNRNLGGAGGFARGLAAAVEGGFTHCLFMDDDAACGDEAIRRTHAFLRLAREPATAVAGAMIAAARPHELWEMGAVFDGMCRPAHHRTDLRNGDAVARMLLAAARPKPPGFYGGWWFFAFPLAAVRHHPFPFFVRGDDSGFCLANRFTLVTLNGVAAVQEDFAAKQSPLTAYLDLRYHLHHLLVQAGLPRRAALSVPVRLVLRPLLRMQYDSAAAALLAWRDVMQGPDHFRTHVDLGRRRAEIAALTRTEHWRPCDLPAPCPARPPPLWRARLCKAALNGHLVPLWPRIGRNAVLPLSHRGPVWPVWGAARVRYVDAAGGRSMELCHDKRRFWGALAGLARLWLRWAIALPALRRAYGESYADMTSPAFWQAEFCAPPRAEKDGTTAGGS